MVSSTSLVFGLHLLIILLSDSSAQEGCSFSCAVCSHGICSECKQGFHGVTCEQTCSSKCRFGDCYDLSGRCKGCQDGWYGDHCDQKCRSSCKGGRCLGISGQCEECEDDRYGYYCEKDCVLCDAGQCDRETGQCVTTRPSEECSSCEPGCPESCDSESDIGGISKTNMFVYSFLGVMVFAVIVGSACGVCKKRQVRLVAKSVPKKQQLIPSDHNDVHCPSQVRQSPKPSTSKHRRESQTQLVVTTAESATGATEDPTEQKHPLFHIMEPAMSSAENPSDHNQHSSPIPESVMGASEQYLRTTNYPAQAACSDLYISMLQDSGPDMTLVTPSGPLLDIPSSSRPRPPPPTYEALFPSS